MAPTGPPKYEKKVYFFHILGLNLKISYQMASLFDVYIYIGERTSGKQDRPSLIIEHPLRAPQIAQNIHIFFTFGLVYEKLDFKLFPLVVHMSRPLLPLDFMYGPNIFFSYFLF